MYRLQIASDVQRDGLGLELYCNDTELLAEVFRSDQEHTVTVTVYRENIPFDALEGLLRRARATLDPFEDGTPLESARNFEYGRM